uniref:hypothetical protein n=1 Tax=Candidatus Electrothrix sp. TaxID=2170559 RepID=UPI0040562DFA
MLTKNFSIVIPTDTTFAYQNIILNETATEMDSPRSIWLYNPESAPIAVKLLSKEEGDGPDSEGIIIPPGAGLPIEFKNIGIHYRIGAAFLTVQGATGLCYISCFFYSNYKIFS